MVFRLLYVTVADLAEAERIAEAAVTSRLAACANILPGMRSIYRWQGAVCRDDEVVLLLKTTAAQAAALTAKVVELHSYSCPCVIQLPIAGGHDAYLDWLQANTAGEA